MIARLALRNVLLRGPRAALAALLVAGGLCALDVAAGYLAGLRAALEQQAVYGQRLGHLAIGPAGASGPFKPDEAARLQAAIEHQRGVQLVVPQLDARGAMLPETGRDDALANTRPLGAPARGGGLDTAENALPADAAPVAILMPPTLAQYARTVQVRTPFIVYLQDPRQLSEMRAALTAAAQRAGLAITVRSWQQRWPGFAHERRRLELLYGCALAVLATLVGATFGALGAIHAAERREELGMLHAQGLRARGVCALLLAEALWTALLGATLGQLAVLAIDALAGGSGILLEPDYRRALLTLAATLALAVLAAMPPALRAARAAKLSAFA